MKNIYVAGHNGMVGSAIVKQLQKDGNNNVITCSKSELNLTSQLSVESFFKLNKIDEVYLAAAKVGGIKANSLFPAEFIYENLAIQNNVINSAYLSGVKKLLFLGSSCIYPKFASQPISEDSLLTGVLEPTNEPYAIAKIAGIKMCESYNRQYGCDFRSIMPTNLYGPGDNFHTENSHVLPALIRRLHDAKVANTQVVTAWGSGRPKREFLYVDDMAEASVHIMNIDKLIYKSYTKEMQSHINVGSGLDCSIHDLVYTVARIVGFDGEIQFDTTKPDGSPRKLMNVDLLTTLGWSYKTKLEDGIGYTYNWFLNNLNRFRS